MNCRLQFYVEIHLYYWKYYSLKAPMPSFPTEREKNPV